MVSGPSTLNSGRRPKARIQKRERVHAVISPMVVPAAILMVDLPVLLLTTILVLIFLYVSRRGIRSPEAVVLLAIYIAYAAVRLGGPGS